MTKLKSIMLTGAVSLLTVSGIISLTAFANPDKKDEPTTEGITIEADGTTENEMLELSDDEFKDFVVSVKRDSDVDYSKLTPEEKDELLKIYDRVEAIMAEVFPDSISDIFEEDIEKAFEKYEDELDKLSKRSSELEKKAGWTDEDALVVFVSNIDDKNLMNKIDNFIDDITDADIEVIADNLLSELDDEDFDELKDFAIDVIDDIDENKIKDFVNDVIDDIDTDKVKDFVNDILDDIDEDAIKDFVDDVLDDIDDEAIDKFTSEVLDDISDADIDKFAEELVKELDKIDVDTLVDEIIDEIKSDD